MPAYLGALFYPSNRIAADGNRIIAPTTIITSNRITASSFTSSQAMLGLLSTASGGFLQLVIYLHFLLFFQQRNQLLYNLRYIWIHSHHLSVCLCAMVCTCCCYSPMQIALSAIPTTIVSFGLPRNCFVCSAMSLMHFPHIGQ